MVPDHVAPICEFFNGLLEGTTTLRDRVGNPLNNGADEVVTFVPDTMAPVVTVNALTTADTTPEFTGRVDDPSAVVEIAIGDGGPAYLATNAPA